MACARLQEDLSLGKFQLFFALAEDALDKAFPKVLKGHPENFHKRLSAMIVKESHTVEKRRGKR